MRRGRGSLRHGWSGFCHIPAGLIGATLGSLTLPRFEPESCGVPKMQDTDAMQQQQRRVQFGHVTWIVTTASSKRTTLCRSLVAQYIAFLAEVPGLISTTRSEDSATDCCLPCALESALEKDRRKCEADQIDQSRRQYMTGFGDATGESR